MARNQHAGPSTLRNRNRVTNKTRLKIIKESIDADPIVLDEDEEKARVVSTAGVDAEDANEHHLQAVLSAAATRHQSTTRSTRATEKDVAPAAFIPTPDSTGIVDNYEELYPPGRWKDPHEYLKSSDTVEESVSFALANGFIYYMDERDKEWLDKNNEEARGEGTSAQGALSGTSTRSGRSAKAKGKDPEITQPAVMSEDEFELVLSVFEKVTHEKTEFLHHGLEQGSPFPPFTDYQDTFASPLPSTMFAVFAAPSWIPQPPQLLRSARAVYPYWRERRMERAGHPIIPIVNLDETDTKNESYICFRRRESKAVRKTRAQQATYSDKMIRLQSELASAMDLAKGIVRREVSKRDLAVQTSSVWEKRFALVDLKRKFPSLGTKEDEELFQDRERVPKRIKTEASGRLPLKLRTRDPGEYGSPISAQPIMKPKERLTLIQNQVDQELASRKEKDHHWDDLLDNPYQPSPVPYSSRLFKVISSSPPSLPLESQDRERSREYRACRLRIGRGGRRLLDRRVLGTRPAPSQTMAKDSDDERSSDYESSRKLAERWRFDDDDEPAVGVGGPEEHDRKLFDDYAVRYLPYHMALISELELTGFLTNQKILLPGPDGHMEEYEPYRRFGSQPHLRRDYQGIQRNGASPMGTPGISTMRHPNGSTMSISSSSGNANISQVKHMPPPPGMPQIRIASNGIIRPPGTPVVPPLPAQASPPHNSPPLVAANGHVSHELSNGTSSTSDQEMKLTVPVAVHANPQVQLDGIQLHPDTPVPPLPISSPMRPKSQTPTMTAIPNGFTIPSINNYPTHIANGSYVHHPGVRPNGISSQQIMKSAFASLSNGQLQTNGHTPMQNTAYLPANYSAQLHAARQMQWAAARSAQRPMDTNGLDGALAVNLTPPIAGVPARAPSTNGTRPTSLPRGLASPALAQAMVAAQGRASPANTHIARLSTHPLPSAHLLSPGLSTSQPHQSPPRPPLPSPSLHSQVVGGPGAGY
ncbi:hypothetical protein PHLCEN_2v12734 [Hermanssonia centrifuga]|uniref:Enhancer of polycomb-like protein n=1 Tax=Hermanssonia centrifuga TaxID=98765 RepID=A0A2R6NGE9_9APHY|nr:hypothetical protein PHLCEN_2v12734 [Hermanssonia centrifuga]